MLPQKENGPNELEKGANSTPRRSLRLRSKLFTLNPTKSDLSTTLESASEKVTDSDLPPSEEPAAIYANEDHTNSVSPEASSLSNKLGAEECDVSREKQTEVEDSEEKLENVKSDSEVCSILKDSSVDVSDMNGINEDSCQESDNINFQIDRLIEDDTISSDKSSFDENSLIDFEAEEGEEDTPSDGSNDIPERGEDINTTESEYSSDGSYDRNSFINDEENHELLSGEEFDLSLDETKRPSRIVQLSSGSDDEVIPLERFKKPVKKRKKSRIIKMPDSSEEEGDAGFIDTLSDVKQSIKDCKTPCDENTVSSENCPQFIIEDNNKIVNSNDKIKIIQVVRIENGMSTKVCEENNKIMSPKEQKNSIATQHEREEEDISYKLNKKRKAMLSASEENKAKKKKIDKSITKIGIVEDALCNQERLFVESNYEELPSVDVSKPKLSSNSVQNKTSKSSSVQSKLSKSLNNKLGHKFHHKDFKSMMLYDNNRVKRMDTHNLLKMKI